MESCFDFWLPPPAEPHCSLNPSLSTPTPRGAAVLSPRLCFGVRLAAFHTFPTPLKPRGPLSLPRLSDLKPLQATSPDRKHSWGSPQLDSPPDVLQQTVPCCVISFSPKPGAWPAVGFSAGEGWICCSVGLGLQPLGLNPCPGG